MSLAAILLGLINIAIVVAILVLVGAIIAMVARWFDFAIDWNVQRLYLLVVALIAIYMLIALLLGLPSVRVIGGFRGDGVPSAAPLALSASAAAHHG